MADRVERVVTEEVPVETARPAAVRPVSGSTLAQRIIWYIAGAILILLAFRFVLTLLGANPDNAFANFIYEVSHPFVSPFFGLFGYNLEYGVSRFEIFTLVAMAVYSVVAWGLAKLFDLNQPEVR
jgi:uncharacterized protein YggT (Ycf19 family)